MSVLSVLLVITLKLPCEYIDAYFSNLKFNQTFTLFSDNTRILEYLHLFSPCSPYMLLMLKILIKGNSIKHYGSCFMHPIFLLIVPHIYFLCPLFFLILQTYHLRYFCLNHILCKFPYNSHFRMLMANSLSFA